MKVRSIKELIALQPPEIAYIVEPQILSTAGNLFIYGQAETWKSWIGIDLMFAVAQGKKWLGVFETHKSSALVIQGEQTEIMYRDRFLPFAKRMNGSLPANLWEATDMNLDITGHHGMLELRRAVEEVKPDVVIIDNWYQFTVGMENDGGLMAKALKNLDSMRQDLKTAFVIMHHPRKDKGDEHGFEEMSGHSILNRWADTVIRTSHVDRDADIFSLAFQKTKNARVRLHPISFKVQRNPFEFHVH